jgi:hypothetical protein
MKRVGRSVRRRCLIFLVLAAIMGSCRSHAGSSRREIVVWKNLGSWASRGSTQTDSFICDSGMLRVQWETRKPGNENKTRGSFKVTVFSEVSGRPLVVAVNHQGIGQGVAYVNEDPREFYLVVDSSDLDWTVAVDEGVLATAGVSGHGRDGQNGPHNQRLNARELESILGSYGRDARGQRDLDEAGGP